MEVQTKQFIGIVAILIFGLSLLLVPGYSEPKNVEYGNSNPPSLGIQLNLYGEVTPRINSTNYTVRVAVLLNGNAVRELHNATLCAYTSHGSVLNSTTIQRLSLYNEEQINMTVESRPAYIIVDHPQIHAPRYNDSGVEIMVRRGENTVHSRYWLNQISIPFEYPRRNLTGHCR